MSPRSERRKRQAISRKQVPLLFASIEQYIRSGTGAYSKDGFEAPYVAASYYLVAHFVSKPFAESFLAPYREPGTLMPASIGMALTTIGETIFCLRKSPCLVEFCDRIATRDPLSAFNEALVAHIFLESGFDITAMKETGVRGEDFDFRAAKDDQTVCVEVTTLQPVTFSDKTIENALAQKVTQLPPNRAGVIVCKIPETWWADETEPNVADRLARHARRLFGNSRRVNFVVFMGEQHNDIGTHGQEYGMLQYRMVAVPNPSPRTPCESLSFLAKTRDGGDLSNDQRLQSMQSQEEMFREYLDREFYRWVNGLIGRTL